MHAFMCGVHVFMCGVYVCAHSSCVYMFMSGVCVYINVFEIVFSTFFKIKYTSWDAFMPLYNIIDLFHTFIKYECMSFQI